MVLSDTDYDGRRHTIEYTGTLLGNHSSEDDTPPPMPDYLSLPGFILRAGLCAGMIVGTAYKLSCSDRQFLPELRADASSGLVDKVE